MSDQATIEAANKAARSLRDALDLPRSVATVSAWMEGGKTVLMVRIEPKWAGRVKIPDSFEGYRVEIKRKLPIRAQKIN
jgi:hypothetical protein